MNSIQPVAALESSMIQTLLNLGYGMILIPDEGILLANFKKQISLHNLQKHLNNTSLSDGEFERLLISLGGKGVFNSAYNHRQFQPLRFSLKYFNIF